jgi:hypothetical protein
LQNYFDNLRAYLKSEAGDVAKRFEQALKSIDSDDEEFALAIGDKYAEEDHEVRKVFPSLLYGSLLVSLCSFVEHTLVRLCQDVAKSKGEKFPEPRGQIIATCAKYLDANLSGAFPQSTEWDRIQGYYTIRNKIVHNRGQLGKSRLKTREEALLAQYASAGTI